MHTTAAAEDQGGDAGGGGSVTAAEAAACVPRRLLVKRAQLGFVPKSDSFFGKCQCQLLQCRGVEGSVMPSIRTLF